MVTGIFGQGIRKEALASALAPEVDAPSPSPSPSPATGGVRKRELGVPAMFIFGDSLVDNGNNNYLATFARADYYPYGIDFRTGPTGRFSNGYTMVDEIAKLLRLPLIPAYLEASAEQILHGINYASAAAGILDITGSNFVSRIPFNQQIRNFENTLEQMKSNSEAQEKVLSSLDRCIFFVGMGSNDYLNNYLMPNYPSRSQFSSHQYADYLVRHYTQQLTRLYKLGARKFVVAGIGVMGCIPSILAQSQSGRCSEQVNQLVLPFNANVKTMIGNLTSVLPASRFVYLDVRGMFLDILSNHSSYGFKVVDKGCCGIGRNRGQISCLPFQIPCENRKEYVFWDAFHPTEAVNIIMGKKAFSGDQRSAFPMNIQQLADL
ncbi:Triacylglycerol lipase [Bertholletia excelsa]